LIGIGGTGMTALAGLLNESGARVTGSDGQLYPPTSLVLEGLGLEVHAGFDPSHLTPSPDLVVVGNAISRGNPELEETLDRGLAYTSMPRLISERFLAGNHSIVVAGTHGKTTTASMLSWVLEQAGRAPGYLIGGAPIGFDSPFRMGKGGAFVIEGDEYDTAYFDKGPKFMHYRPDTALLGAVEFDHADIYRDLDQVKLAFARLVNLVPRRGLLVRDEDCEVTREVSSRAFCRVEGCGIEQGFWRAAGFTETERGCSFGLLRGGDRIAQVEMGVPGEHNARNALAVIAVAHEQGLAMDDILAGLATFRGVKRRMELRGEENGIKVFDDFAHHPTAIGETLATLRRRHPDSRIWAVLEPRSWSMRRNVFQDRLLAAFELADDVIIAEVYGADALPEEQRLDAGRLVEDLRAAGRRARHLPEVVEIVSFIRESAAPGDVVVIMSNGGFGGIHGKLLDALRAGVNA
jgi:UDP-N-acetylmuramate: L-alanyl-gamma-D-glutamyl-meso-diaminopimelate ligase